MHDDDPNTDESPQTEPAATPLISVADVPTRRFLVMDTDEGRLYVIEQTADRFVTDGGCDSYDGTVTGLLGENAFAKALPLDVKPDTEIYEDGDGGFDFRFRGAKIDVKTAGRGYDDPALTVDAYASLDADYYVLAHRIGARSVRLLGYAPRTFVANAPTMEHRGRPYHFVEQEYLFPLLPWAW